MNGHIQLQRRFFRHWLWESDQRIFSRAEAFLDLLQLAAFTHTKKLVSGSLITLEPGQLCASERYLSERWKWSTTKVRAYLTLLEADEMVVKQKKQGTTVITLCNWEDYNRPGSAEKAQKKQRESSGKAAGKRIEEGKEGEEGNTPPSPQGGDGGGGQAEPGRVLPENWKRMSAVERKRQKVLRNSPTMVRIGSWFGRKESTLWSIEEAAAFNSLRPSADEIDLMEEFYTAIITEKDFRRRELLTLLNNWNGELDKARLWKEESHE